MDFFNKYGTVLAVWRRYFPGGGNHAPRAITNASSEATDDANSTNANKSNDNTNRTKPSVFVVFETA